MHRSRSRRGVPGGLRMAGLHREPNCSPLACGSESGVRALAQNDDGADRHRFVSVVFAFAPGF